MVFVIVGYIVFNAACALKSFNSGAPHTETGLLLLFGLFIELYKLVKKLVAKKPANV
jgi:hypothetical protein